MAQYVNDTKAGKSISAYIILDKKGKLVGKILASFTDTSLGGRCLVNVFDWTPEAEADYETNKRTFQQATRNGCGYDKFTSALDGLTFGPYVLSDHCSSDPATKAKIDKLMADYNLAMDREQDTVNWNDRAKKIGVSFANWSRECNRWTSLYKESGIKYLEAMGYQVVQAI